MQLLFGGLVKVSLSLVAALDLQTQFFLKNERHLNIVQPLLFLVKQFHPLFYLFLLVFQVGLPLLEPEHLPLQKTDILLLTEIQPWLHNNES